MRTLLWVTVLTSSACGGETLVACTAEARPGLSVTVRDSVSGATLSDGVEVVAQEGAWADTARSSLIASGVYSLAYERPGRYEVTVNHPAYQPWLRSNVHVTADECHVRTVTLLARLQAKP